MTDAQPLPEYVVRRSQRARRARVTVNDSGEAVVVLPARAPERVAAQLVQHHARWIERHVGIVRERHRALSARPALGEGRSVWVDGVPCSVVIEPARGRRSSVRFAEAPRVISVARAAGDRRTASELLEAWLRRLARDRIHARVDERAREMRVAPARVAIRDQRSRWGSASARGSLSFSWRLILCPPHVLDYVVVHELAHLRVPGHSPAFWALVAAHCVDPASARRWLRQNHADVRHALA